jgi:hypothetical protein
MVTTPSPNAYTSFRGCFDWLEASQNRNGSWSHALTLERERQNNERVAFILVELSNVNRVLGLHKEGIQRAKEALEIYERLGDTIGQASVWISSLFRCIQTDSSTLQKRPDSAQSNFSRRKAKNISSVNPIALLANIYLQGREREGHSPLRDGPRNRFFFQLARSPVLDSLRPRAAVSRSKQVRRRTHHIEQAKSHVVNDAYLLGRAVEFQALIRYGQRRLKEARSEASHAIEIFEKLGAAGI